VISYEGVYYCEEKRQDQGGCNKSKPLFFATIICSSASKTSLFVTWNGRLATMSQGSFLTMMVLVVHEDQRKLGSCKCNLTKEVEKHGEELKIPAEGKVCVRYGEVAYIFRQRRWRSALGVNYCQAAYLHR
jgi:hypothetical protein